jgi:hypothetical protein
MAGFSISYSHTGEEVLITRKANKHEINIIVYFVYNIYHLKISRIFMILSTNTVPLEAEFLVVITCHSSAVMECEYITKNPT